jgi:hypothetical protein
MIASPVEGAIVKQVEINVILNQRVVVCKEPVTEVEA